MSTAPPDEVRLDKWLWAARFFKTRSLATDQVGLGRVRVNGDAAKPAKLVRPGDRIALRAGEREWEVVVLALNEQRRPAEEARQLYEETQDSRECHVRAVELRKLAPQPVPDVRGRPTKRDRRRMEVWRCG